MLQMSYSPKIDPKLCNGCGKCYDECPMDVFGWDEAARRPTVAHPGECRFCLICEMNCPEIALDVGLPLHLMFDFGITPIKK